MDKIQPKLTLEEAEREVSDRKIKQYAIGKLQKIFVNNRIRLRGVIVDWLDYIHLHFKIKQNKYFTIFGLDELYNIDDDVLHRIKDISTQDDYTQKEKDKLNDLYQDLQKYKSYDDRFKEQPDKIFNDKFKELNPINGNDPISVAVYKTVKEQWLNLINKYYLNMYVPPPPNQKLSANDLQTIIKNILASPIETRNANPTTNNMLNDIDSEFGRKLKEMVLSEPNSELGDRRSDEHQTIMDNAFRDRARQQPQHMRRNMSLLPTRGAAFGGRQYKKPRKSTATATATATKRRPRRKSSAIKHRPRRTSRK